MNQIAQTARTTLKRLPKRGSFDRDVINAILDEGFVCHVGFVMDGKPFVIPTGYARVDDRLIIHGSQASRMLRSLGQGIDVCVTVTLIDGLVLARSAFHHSMNYRSVVIFGRASVIENTEEKGAALLALSEHMIRGRWADAREPNEQELQLTTVLSLPIDEASAKYALGRRWMMKKTMTRRLGLVLFRCSSSPATRFLILDWQRTYRLRITLLLTTELLVSLKTLN